MIINLRSIFTSLLVLSAAFCYAQLPNFSYTSPQTFNTGAAITTVKPTNTGGAVPAFAYGQVSLLAGGTGVAGFVNATGAAARFNVPLTLTADAAGNVFVVDNVNNVVRKITSAGVVTTYAGTGAYGATNGPASQATFAQMYGIAVDASDNLYIADKGNDLIRKVSASGVVSTVAGKADVSGFANGQDTTAIFSILLGIAVDKSDNVYVIDQGSCMVRKITPGGLVSTLAGKFGVNVSANGPDSSATFFYPQACAVDAAGNVYVAEPYDVRKISAAGMVTTIAGSGKAGSADGVGTAASFNSLNSISVDALGNLYVADAGNYTIRKIAPDGTVSTIAGTAGVTGSANGIGAAAQLGDGVSAYAGNSGVVYLCDEGNSIIRKLSIKGYAIDKPLPTGLAFDGTTGDISGTPAIFSPATDYTVTGYNVYGNSAAKINITTTGTLSFPLIPAKIYGVADFSPAISTSGAITYTSSNTAVATVVSGNIHVIGVGTSTIKATNGATTLSQVLTVNTAPLVVIADNKSKNYNTANPALTITYDGFVNGEGPSVFTTQPTISTPTLAGSPAGSYPINISGAANKNYTITFVAGTLTVLGGTVTTAAPELTYPAVLNFNTGVAITPVVPANSGGAVPANAFGQITVIAGTPGQGGYVDATGAAARFEQPNDVALDAAGNIYVADATNNVIRKITPAGVVTTLAGRGTTALTTFVFPASVAVDAAGNVYLTDTFDNEIKEVTPQGVVSIFAGGGTQLNGQGTQASFSAPSGITIDKSGNFYVADQGNDLIRKITPTGLVSTIAGQQGVKGSANGQGTVATFSRLNEITVDGNGNVYVTDANLVRKITAGGLVSTFAGSGAFASVDGKGTAASFEGPWGVAVEPGGLVYVAEYGKIRKITPGGVVSTVIGAPNASGTVAQNTIGFDYLGGLKVDPSGNLYTCDIAQDIVAKFTATGYTIDKTLPAGLVFDATTGKISGTPAAGLPPTFFTINAYNISGESTSVINLSVTGSSVATLSSLKTSKGTLSPVFAAATTGYTASVVNGVTSLTVTPTTTDPYATITVNGTAVASGAASGAINLNVGTNVIGVVVTASDGTTTKTYTVTVTRPASNIDNLATMWLSAGTLTPAFAPATTSYTASEANGVAAITITPTTADPTAVVTVNGKTVTSGTVSGAIALGVGSNTINVVVTAQDGVTTKTYTVTVTRAAPVNNFDAILDVSKPLETPTLNEDGIVVHQSVSPNGDGINDFLTIENIANYPENKLTIINRNGLLVYQATGYDNSSKAFDGHSNKNGQMQLPGTYFYQLDYTVKGITKTKTGFIVLKY
jgi:gliding motility-associated-like protein